MKVAILIAVRLKSTRLPRKALEKIGSQTLIEHLIDRLKKCKKADEIILCTSTHPDDQILLRYAEKKGIKSFAGSEEDVLERFIKAAESVNADVIVRVTGDNPLTDPEYIDRMIEKQRETNAEYVYTEGLPRGTKAEVMTVDALRKAHELAYDPNQSEYMTLYFKTNFFKVEKVEADESVKRPGYRLTIDTPEDLNLMREIEKKLGKDLYEIKLKEIIELLDKNPELRKINLSVRPRNIGKEIVKTCEGPKIKITIKDNE